MINVDTQSEHLVIGMDMNEEEEMWSNPLLAEDWSAEHDTVKGEFKIIKLKHTIQVLRLSFQAAY